jgi:CSLREA domain-containing protein
MFAAPASADTTITVNTTADTYGAADSHCSLRDAITAANNGTAFGTCPASSGAVTISLPADTSVYTLSIAPTGSDDNASGDLNISHSVTIKGGGAASTAINGAGLDRIFHIASGAVVTISGLTLANGQAPQGATGATGATGGTGGDGGAILNAGSLTVDETTIQYSAAGTGGQGGGSIGPAGGNGGGQGGSGGGIASTGPLTLGIGTGIVGDQAGDGGPGGGGFASAGSGGSGGGVQETGSTLTVNHTVFANNVGGAGSSGGFLSGSQGGGGGAIAATGALTVNGSFFNSNTGGAGATVTFAGSGGSGGAILAGGATTITGTSFTSNTSGQTPSGQLPAAGGNGGAISSAAALTLASDTFTQNKTPDSPSSGDPAGASGAGGAVSATSSLTVSKSTFTGNATGVGGSSTGSGASGGASGAGGAISAQGGSISDSTFSGNATGTGGASSSGAAGASGGGGAVEATGKLSVLRDTFDSNTVGAPGSPNGSSSGGDAVYGTGSAALTVTNDTLAGNGTTGRGSTGVILVDAGSGTLDAVTAANNNAPAVTQSGSGAVSLADTLLSSNAGGSCSGTITNSGHNLAFPATDTSCGAGFASGDPKLSSTLANNGGPTKTLALGTGSAAIDAGPTTTGADCPSTDQRGVGRPQGKACDIGAFEAATPAITITTPANGATYTHGQLVKASYKCTEGGSVNPISSCSGTVPSGSAINTSTLGSHSFTVHATDLLGAQVSKSVSYTVRKAPNLKVTFKGDGHGTVKVNGKSCTKSCSHSYLFGAVVTVSAKAKKGSTFKSFGGACHGRKCKLTLRANKSVTVTFTTNPPNTTITKRKIGRTQASFSFTGSGGRGRRTFQCRLDRGKWRSCKSPRTLSNLTPGSTHRFSVRAVDARHKADHTPATVKFTLKR